MELYMQNKEHGRMILESVKHGPLIWPTIKENGVTRTKKYEELFATEKIQADFSNDLWERIQLLMQGTLLTKQERECKLYDAFDKFAHIKGELLHQYYLRFTQLINDINIYKKKLEQFQVNTKFLNSLPPEWSKFMTDVKIVKDLHTTNFDQLNSYLEQHEIHANEVHIMRERSQDPLTLVANHQMTPSHLNTLHQDACLQPQSIPQIEYTVSIVNQQTHLAEFPQIDSGLAVPVFKQGDDLINAINKMMSFLSTIVISHFPTTNNQLRNSSNLRQQATIHDGRVTIQPVYGRQSQQRVVKCFNCQEECHIARQCPKPKRKMDATWFRDKVLLVEAQGSSKVLN
ncbi:integrase, catalytic region, zinc finger, CCHC-type containing protein [Tanacetum coccineum]